jgi:hypothetical protein
MQAAPIAPAAPASVEPVLRWRPALLGAVAATVAVAGCATTSQPAQTTTPADTSAPPASTTPASTTPPTQPPVDAAAVKRDAFRTCSASTPSELQARYNVASSDPVLIADAYARSFPTPERVPRAEGCYNAINQQLGNGP